MPSAALTWPAALAGTATAAGLAANCVWLAAQAPLAWLPQHAVVGGALLAACVLTWLLSCCEPATRRAAWYAGLALGACGALFVFVELVCQLFPVQALVAAAAATAAAVAIAAVLVACVPGWLLLRGAALATRLAGRLAIRAAFG